MPLPEGLSPQECKLPPKDLHCSFCDKLNHEVEAVVWSGKDNNAAICNECFVWVSEIMEDTTSATSPSD